MEDPDRVTVVVTLPRSLMRRLKESNQSVNLAVSEIFRKDLEYCQYLIRQEQKGSKILIEKPDGKQVQIIRK